MIQKIDLLQSGDQLGISRDRQAELIARMAFLAEDATTVGDLVDAIVRQKDMTEIEKIFFAFGGGVAQVQMIKVLPRLQTEMPRMFVIKSDDPKEMFQAAEDLIKKLLEKGGPGP